jgi:hypothetical protein
MSFYEIHFTGEGFRSLGVYKHFYRVALQRLLAVEAQYEADVKDWYENGDGRPTSEGGRGYRYPECIHGSSLWTDYDNICGPCELGATAVALAIGEARTRWLTFVGVYEWMSATPAAIPEDIRRQIVDFSVTLFPKGA